MSALERKDLYLIRHGQLDLQAFAKSQFAAGLTPQGRAQARLTARRLRSLQVSAIHCSTLGRARETAAIISAQFPEVRVRASTLLWELPNVGPANDDTWRTMFARGKERAERAFLRFVRPARGKPSVEILITHGNLIRYFVCRVLGIAPESWSTLGFSHCGITQLTVRPEGIRMVCYNETGHLPDRLRS
jgi:serine/threonine-protein phosphatase PGAM5